MNITPETLAGIAVHLLQGKDYNDAVRRAYGLLRAAEKEIQLQEEIAAQPAANAPAHMDYKAGIRFITDQSRGDRAEQYFTEFMARSIPQANQIEAELPIGKWPGAKGVPKNSKQELCDAITRYEKQGFLGWQLLALREMYQQSRKKHLEPVPKGQT